VGHRHDLRSHSLVVDRALTDNKCVHYTRAYQHVSKRCLEVGQAVENEMVVCGNSAGLISDNQGSSGTSLNSVVQDYVVLCVAPDVDRCAIRVENRPLGRVHVYVVVHNDGAFDGPLSNWAVHTNACRSGPPGMNRVARDEIRTGACDVNHVSSTAISRIGIAHNGTRGYHVPLDVRSSVDLV